MSEVCTYLERRRTILLKVCPAVSGLALVGMGEAVFFRQAIAIGSAYRLRRVLAMVATPRSVMAPMPVVTAPMTARFSL